MESRPAAVLFVENVYRAAFVKDDERWKILAPLIPSRDKEKKPPFSITRFINPAGDEQVSYCAILAKGVITKHAELDSVLDASPMRSWFRTMLVLASQRGFISRERLSDDQFYAIISAVRAGGVQNANLLGILERDDQDIDIMAVCSSCEAQDAIIREKHTIVAEIISAFFLDGMIQEMTTLRPPPPDEPSTSTDRIPPNPTAPSLGPHGSRRLSPPPKPTTFLTAARTSRTGILPPEPTSTTAPTTIQAAMSMGSAAAGTGTTTRSSPTSGIRVKAPTSQIPAESAVIPPPPSSAEPRRRTLTPPERRTRLTGYPAVQQPKIPRDNGSAPDIEIHKEFLLGEDQAVLMNLIIIFLSLGFDKSEFVECVTERQILEVALAKMGMSVDPNTDIETIKRLIFGAIKEAYPEADLTELSNFLQTYQPTGS